MGASHCDGIRKSREILAKSAGTESGGTSSSTLTQSVVGLFHLIVSLGLILATDKYLKKAFVAAAIKFPSALFRMFCIFSLLIVLDSTLPSAATALMNFFERACVHVHTKISPFVLYSIFGCPASFCQRYSACFWHQNLPHSSWRMASYDLCCRFHGYSSEKSSEDTNGRCRTYGKTLPIFYL
ncbi:hypothetical protein S83_054802 [Arachis hypogaea]